MVAAAGIGVGRVGARIAAVGAVGDGAQRGLAAGSRLVVVGVAVPGIAETAHDSAGTGGAADLVHVRPRGTVVSAFAARGVGAQQGFAAGARVAILVEAVAILEHAATVVAGGNDDIGQQRAVVAGVLVRAAPAVGRGGKRGLAAGVGGAVAPVRVAGPHAADAVAADLGGVGQIGTGVAAVIAVGDRAQPGLASRIGGAVAPALVAPAHQATARGAGGRGVGQAAALATAAAIVLGQQRGLATVRRLVVAINPVRAAALYLAASAGAGRRGIVERAAGSIAHAAIVEGFQRCLAAVVDVAVAVGISRLAISRRADASGAGGIAVRDHAPDPAGAAIGQPVQRGLAAIKPIPVAIVKAGPALDELAASIVAGADHLRKNAACTAHAAVVESVE